MRPATPMCAMVSALALLNCSPVETATVTDAERAAVSDTLREFAARVEQGVEALDVAVFAPIFSSSPDLTWGADGQMMLIPRDSLMSLYRSVYQGFQSIDFTWDTLRVSVLNPEVGVLVGEGHFVVTDTSGVAAEQGVAVTYVFVRENGQWRLRHGHASHRPLAQ